jgi:hypothetical protein
MSEINYELLRLDVLQKLIDERGITCKNKKDEIIKYLIMDDEGKYIRETTYERASGGFIVGIDINNKNHMLQISNLILKKEARNIGRYSDNRLQYWSSQKLV